MTAEMPPAASSRKQGLLPWLRWLLIALYVIIVALWLTGLPDTVKPGESLGSVATVLSLAVPILCMATAAMLLRQPMNGVTLLTALAMIALPPLTFVLRDVSFAMLPGSLSGLVGVLVYVVAFAGLLATLILLFVFPNGRFVPRWTRWPLAVGLTGLVILPFIPNTGDIGLFGLIGMLSLLLAMAAAAQVYRYRQADETQQRQTAWFVMAAVAFPAMILLASTGVNSGSLLLLFMPVILLALGLAIAAGRGVWGQPFTTTDGWVYAGVFGVLLVAAGAVVGAAAVYWQRENQPVVVDAAALDTGETVPILLDTDMAFDDVIALFYLLQHPAVDLRAITVNGVVFVRCEAGVRNALGLLEIAGAPELPVACGRDKPYPGGTPAPDEWRDEADALFGGQVLLRDRRPDPRPAAELLADTVRAAPGEITVVAIGPLTNLAEAFEADPSLPEQIKEIVIMGGALEVPGNLAFGGGSNANPYADRNTFADPVAADIVLASGAPIRLVPLDATNQVPINYAFYEQLTARHESKPATFVYNLFYLNPGWLDGGLFWWDPLAAAGALDHSLLTWRETHLDVITEEGPQTGRVVEVDGGSPASVAVAADARRFEALLLALLNRQ